MGSIADLFFTGRLDDGQLQVDAKKAGDKAGKTLASSMSSTLRSGSKELVSGIKLGAGIAAFGGLESAVTGVVGALGDAVQAAREDEESQARLGAALRANIKDWDGNTSAIEAIIASRQRLGFTDEEQRKSLALLVVATHDANKALEIQATAMDLARLKGISLEEASAALIKVEGGQYRALKALGIQLPKNATATEALAAVQKAAAGSAETFADTSEGKLLASQIKVGEAMERLGYILLPIVTEGMTVAADVAETLIDGLAQVAIELDKLSKVDPNNPLDSFAASVDPVAFGRDVRDYIGWLTAGTNETLDAYKKTKDAAAENSKDVVKNVQATRKALADAQTAAKAVGTSFDYAAAHSGERGAEIAGANDKIGDSATKMSDDTVKAFERVRIAALKLRTGLLLDSTKIVNDYYDVLIAKDDLAATNAEINALRTIATKRKLTSDEITQLHRLEQTQAQTLADLASKGASQSAVFTSAIDGLLKRLKNAHGAERRAILAEITQLKLLAIAAKIANGQVLTLNESIGATLAKGGYINASGAGGKATGGPVTAGTPYWVGERGPEIVVPGMNSTVIPHTQSVAMAAAATGTGGDTFHLSVQAVEKVQRPIDIVRELRIKSQQGYLGRRRA